MPAKKRTHSSSKITESKSPEVKATEFVERDFESSDQKKLSENEHHRFLKASPVVGHAWVIQQPGKIIFKQYHAPGTHDSETPEIKPLYDFSVTEKYGRRFYHAKTADGTEMIARRSLDLSVNPDMASAESGEVWMFSPKSSHMWNGDYFWGGSATNVPLFKQSEDPGQLAFKQEYDELPRIIKQETWTVHYPSVPIRESQKIRTPDQNTVMGGSAIDAYQAFYERYKKYLHEGRSKIFERAEAARPYYTGGAPRTQQRPEWLHIKGYGLTHMEHEPQLSENLGAAPKWMNTQMMLTERTAKWYALNRPRSTTEGYCRFEMLPESEIVEKGLLSFEITEHERKVKLSQNLQPWVKFPDAPKPTDIAQTVMLTHKVLSNQAPDLIQEVAMPIIGSTDPVPMVISMPKPIIERNFEACDQDRLSENEHERFVPASQMVGHALITHLPGKVRFKQFRAPGGTKPETSEIKQLCEFEMVEKYGKRFYKAKTMEGIEMIARRHVKVCSEQGEESELWTFSPKTAHMWKGEYFFGGNDENVALFKEPENSEQKSFIEHYHALPRRTKQEQWSVHYPSVPIREAQTTRTPDQNTVMGGSAIDAYKAFQEKYKDYLNPDRKRLFQKAEEARPLWRGGAPKSQARPEWLHGKGYGLTHIEDDPQKSENLGAAPKWMNTQMMVTERTARWMASNRPHSTATGEFRFSMLPDSEIIETGDLAFRFEEGDQKIQLSQTLRPWQKYPDAPKPTDIAQTVLVTHQLLTKQSPSVIDEWQFDTIDQRMTEADFEAECAQIASQDVEMQAPLSAKAEEKEILAAAITHKQRRMVIKSSEQMVVEEVGKDLIITGNFETHLEVLEQNTGLFFAHQAPHSPLRPQSPRGKENVDENLKNNEEPSQKRPRIKL